jgi:hypothetical protein
VDEPTGTEGHEDHTNAEKDCGRQLQAERDEPCGFLLRRASAADEVRAVVDPETDHDAESDGQLLETNKRTTNLGRCDFGIVHGNNHGERANTHTGDESSGEDGVVAGADRGGLDDDTNDEDGDVDKDGVFTGENLCEETRVHSSEPGTELENGDEPTLLGGVPGKFLWILNVITHVWSMVSDLFDRMPGAILTYES